MNLIHYFFFFVLSFIGTFYLVPFFNKVGHKYNIFDVSRDSEISKSKKVRIGGLSFFFPYILCLILYLILFNSSDNQFINLIPYITIGSLMLVCVGLIDDIFNLSPWPRLAIQFCLSIFIWIIGINVKALDFSFFQFNEFIYLNKYLNFFFTILWTTGLINAINWIDGMDGLAISLLTITSSFYFISAYQGSFEIICVLTSAIIGCCLGFFIYNKNPSKILMGDSGSYFLGFNLAIISLLGSSSNNLINSKEFDGFIFNLPHALLLLSVPIFDMAFVILYRISKKKSPFFPDKSHIHHRLFKLGFNVKQSLLIICTISLITSIVGTKLYFT